MYYFLWFKTKAWDLPLYKGIWNVRPIRTVWTLVRSCYAFITLFSNYPVFVHFLFFYWRFSFCCSKIVNFSCFLGFFSGITSLLGIFAWKAFCLICLLFPYQAWLAAFIMFLSFSSVSMTDTITDFLVSSIFLILCP